MSADQSILKGENERLRTLLREARQYVSDAMGDEDSETQRNSADLLRWIDDALLYPYGRACKPPKWPDFNSRSGDRTRADSRQTEAARLRLPRPA